MQYKVKGKIIKSENAAKSILQPNKEIMKWISSLDNDFYVLDYGCGKFRYTVPLSEKVKNVIAVDSIEQIYRKQIVNGEYCNLIEYANEHLNNVSVYDVANPIWCINKYDKILCTNVLSSIPFKKERLIILKRLKSLIKENGDLLISTQYRNSYFNNYNVSKNASKFNDGWIIRNNSYFTFYGLITIEKLIDICEKSGLIINRKYVNDGSAYVYCRAK